MAIFVFQVILKIHRKLGWWRHKNDYNSKNLKFDFFFLFSRFRIFHVNLNTFQNFYFIFMFHKCMFWLCMKSVSQVSMRQPVKDHYVNNPALDGSWDLTITATYYNLNTTMNILLVSNLSRSVWRVEFFLFSVYRNHCVCDMWGFVTSKSTFKYK